ncbi:MAG: hypothetical protein M3Y32_09305 [Pseudomonadota bacterium]|nr:hypothetical protein [Pseudomonadota bacterium]
MTDIRALLLTDVVDSTRLSEQLGDVAMAALWAAHDRCARDLLPAWRGREIDKTDGMLLLFGTAADAAGYAAAYQSALAKLPVPLSARAGLHVGPVILRENSADDVARGAKPLEVDGLAKPIAARVMSLAHGGQILLTPEARAALGDAPLQGLRLQSHGHWMIKGVAEPLELFEVGNADVAFDAPPDSAKVWRVAQSGGRWLPVRQLPNNLPQQMTSFVGRETELAELKTLLERNRLVTLLGMGGLGKTRLSLQAAIEVMPRFPDGTWFLDLAPIRDPALVVDEAAQALGVREAPGLSLIQSLCAYCKTRKLLLIVDNCEHLVQAVSELVATILRAAPQVHAIASSREALQVPGEQIYPLHPLPLPAAGVGVGHDLRTLQRSTAVRLFVDRAQAHKPSFALTERDAPAVAELVSRVEGIPLAIELAAARMRSMSVVDINARLKDRYKLLTGGGRVLLERQQTLRGLVDWSYDLLNADEQTVLQRLGVFAGGFDLEAAEAVCSAAPIDPTDVLDRLDSLVQKSLVMLDESSELPRYRMLETIGDYAREKLATADDVVTTAERHCQHFFVFSKAANIGLKGREQAEWIVRMEAELDNVRAAIKLALAGGVDPFIAVKFTVALLGFWLLRGYATEGRATVKETLALAPIRESELAQAWALYVGAALAGSQSDHAESRRMLEQCLVLRRRLGNPIDIAATLSTLSLARLPAGEAPLALDSEREALDIFRNNGDRMGEAIGLLHLGHIHRYTGEVEAARDYLEQSLTLACELQNQEVEGECELMLGVLAFECGDTGEARRHGARSLTVCREAGDKRGVANATRWLGKVDLEGGDTAAARSRLCEALQAFRAFEMREELLGCLEDHASLLRLMSRPRAAAGLLAMAESARERLALARSPSSLERLNQSRSTLREILPEPDFETAWAEGNRWDVDTAIRHALADGAAENERELCGLPG